MTVFPCQNNNMVWHRCVVVIWVVKYLTWLVAAGHLHLFQYGNDDMYIYFYIKEY